MLPSSARTSASISCFVRFSVTATRKQSASSGYHRPSGTPARKPASRASASKLVDSALPIADDEFFERRRVERQLESLVAAKLLGSVARFLQAEVGRFAQPLRTEQRQIDRRPQGEQALVRADVARGLFAADVLLAGLQREHEAALAAAIDRLAGDAARHAADEAFAAGHDAEVGAAVLHGRAQRLPFGDGDVGAPIAGPLQAGPG